MQAALREALQGVTPDHLEAATEAAAAADLRPLPSAQHLAGEGRGASCSGSRLQHAQGVSDAHRGACTDTATHHMWCNQAGRPFLKLVEVQTCLRVQVG